MVIKDADAVKVLAHVLMASEEMYDNKLAQGLEHTPYALGLCAGMMHQSLSPANVTKATQIAKALRRDRKKRTKKSDPQSPEDHTPAA